MAERELPIIPPKPMFVSMPAAVSAAIAQGNRLPDINLLRWSATYGCEPEAIKTAWEACLSRRSQVPSNDFEMPEGK